MNIRPIIPLVIVGAAIAFLFSGCSKDDNKVSVNTDQGQVEMVQKFNVGMPVGEIEDQKHGKEVWLAVGPVMGVGGVAANGVGYGHGFENGAYMLSGQVNIELAPEGSFYQAWLKNEDTGEIIEAGRPQPNFGDVRHGLRHESATDLSAFRTIIITLEADDGNPEMGTIVAQGTLKEQKRTK